MFWKVHTNENNLSSLFKQNIYPTRKNKTSKTIEYSYPDNPTVG